MVIEFVADPASVFPRYSDRMLFPFLLALGSPIEKSQSVFHRVGNPAEGAARNDTNGLSGGVPFDLITGMNPKALRQSFGYGDL